jgi:mannose-1-phosphate guanylyltransferase
MPTNYAVIMAGGAGTRLWPLSRRGRPKQVLKLFGERSLLSMSFERLRGLTPPQHIWIIGAEQHRAACLADLPELPPENYLGEPCPRDTAAAVGLSAAVLAQRDPDAVVGVFTADHVITPVERFAAAVQRGYQMAAQHPEALVTFAIRPTSPHTGYGYIERGELVSEGVHRAARFTEKPDLPTARSFLTESDPATGRRRYAWNSGMFCWRAATILGELQRQLPETHDAVRRLARDPSRIAEVYPTLRRISIDFAVMERAANVLMVDMDVIWQDVGSWSALRADSTAAPNVVALDARNCTFVSEDDHLIAALGVEDLIVVHSPDATLVCRRADAERIKELLAQVQARHGARYE